MATSRGGERVPGAHQLPDGLERDSRATVDQLAQGLVHGALAFAREIERLKMKLATMQTDALIQQAREIRGVKVIAARVQELDAKGLRNFADVLKQKLQSGIVALAVEEADGRVSLIATVTKDLTGRYHAGNIIKAVAGIIGGSGGGRPDMAQAGGKHPEKLAEAFEKVYQVVESFSA